MVKFRSGPVTRREKRQRRLWVVPRRPRAEGAVGRCSGLANVRCLGAAPHRGPAHERVGVSGFLCVRRFAGLALARSLLCLHTPARRQTTRPHSRWITFAVSAHRLVGTCVGGTRAWETSARIVALRARRTVHCRTVEGEGVFAVVQTRSPGLSRLQERPKCERVAASVRGCRCIQRQEKWCAAETKSVDVKHCGTPLALERIARAACREHDAPGN